jgi:hypothetical protein
MSFLNALINNVDHEELREELQERVDIILHKIKFMDKVPVITLDSDNTFSSLLNVVLEAAGGEPKEDAMEARVVIYHEPRVGMLEMMGIIPGHLNKEWPAVQFNRVYILDDQSAYLSDPEHFVNTLEDVVEILYPGYFVFGNEGRNWTGFSV